MSKIEIVANVSELGNHPLRLEDIDTDASNSYFKCVDTDPSISNCAHWSLVDFLVLIQSKYNRKFHGRFTLRRF